MKKLILLGSALLISLGFAKAQGWETTGVHDDFATATVYKNGTNLEGIIWWEDGSGVYTLTRPGDGTMTVGATNAGGCNSMAANCYAVFGANFNDSNDDGTGTPFEIDLSGGQADIQIDIENTHATDMAFLDVKLEDNMGIQGAIEPNISDMNASMTWADPERKALNGFTLAAGERKTVTIDLSSVPSALGGLTIGTYNCDAMVDPTYGPYTCPTTTYSIDPSRIVAVLFRVNFGADNIDLSEGDGDHTTETFISGGTISSFTGNLVIHDFKIGSTISGVNEELINNSLSVYPNPAADVLNVSFKSAEGAEVSVSDIVGNTVFATSAASGTSEITVNTSALSSGVYILNIATANGTVARKVVID